MRDVLLFIHILAIGTWLGANVTQLVVSPVMQRTGGSPAAAWMRQTARMGVVLYTPAAVVALLTGIFLVIDGPQWEFEQAFVVIGFLTVVVGALLGARVFGPKGREVADLHDSGEETNAGVLHGKLRMWALLDTALVTITIYAMVAKLGSG